ncbi:RELT-like protein 2 [Mixophyes fleayi]|uniref:RELT-like protein 2 n=1 Tax=Mixophyes fleayi TaxID=3061075 RepID=UPI003F4DE101
MVAGNETEDEKEKHNPYMPFLLVLVFFITGLLGFLICHILKKKGYRCRTSPEELDPEKENGPHSDQDNTDEISNEDTVERIVKCIIQNEANAEALKQMLGETEGEVPIGPSLCPHRESQDAGPPHHHTVHLGSTQAPCIHCSRKKRNLLHRMGRSKDSRGKSHPGEVTVFSVGRFRVTHIGKKSSNQGSQDDPNVCSETFSSDKDLEEQQEKKPKNGISTHWTYGTLDLSQNGPEVVELAKSEIKKDADIKLEDSSGLKLLKGKVGSNLTKSKGSKDRRSSAPEQTAAQRERIDVLQLRGHEQQKEAAGKQPSREDASREQ